MKKTFLLCVSLLLGAFGTYAQDLILNEIVAKNALSYANSAGKSPDWIELRNVSSQTIDLSEYSITTGKMRNVSVSLGTGKLSANGYYLIEATKGNANVVQWSSVVNYGDAFSFIVPSENIPNWTSPSFDDSQWNMGKTPIGYGESDITTTVTDARSIFIRKKFTVAHLEYVTQMILHMDCDDGFIAYINGKEIARSNMNSTNFDAFATTYTEGVMRNNEIPPSYNCSDCISALKEGENTLCIQIHNCSNESSDLIGIPILSIGYSDNVSNVNALSKYLDLPCGKSLTLDASSDTLFLMKGDKIIDSISWKNLPVDVSIGRSTTDYKTTYYFSTTTPRSANSGAMYVAKTLSKPKLDMPAGVYEDEISVNAYSSDKHVILRYTTNGDEPTTSSSLVTGAIHLSNNANIKVKAFRDGYLPSATMIASYLFLPDITLPIASLTIKRDDFFNYKTGIYVTGPNASSEEPYYGANYWQDWERPVHLDFFNEDGECVVSQDLGCKIGGNWSRAHPQKTLKLYARDQYGKDKIEYQFYKDKPISSFHMILLRNSGNDFNHTQMRDGLISVLAREMDIDRQAYQPAVVYINGEYYGIQNVREKQNEHYIAENYGYDKDDIDIVKNGWEVQNGSDDHYWEMRDFIEDNDMSYAPFYEKAKELLDIPSYIDYYVLETYIVNEDWPSNNFACWHSRSQNTPWRYLLFDCDFGFGIWDLNGKVNKNMLQWCTATNSDHYANTPDATALLRSLMRSPEFRRDYMNATADRLNTTLSPKNVRTKIDSVYNLIKEEMPSHIALWGYNWQEGWFDEMKSFGQRREAIMRQQTEEFFSTNGSYKLTLNLSEQGAGKIHLNTIDVKTFPWSGSYFNNNTIFLTAIPNPGYEFVRWEGAVNSTEQAITVTTAEATSLTAVFNYVGNEPQIRFTEVYYHTFQDGETEWIEVLNEGETAVDLSNWNIIIDRCNQSFTIPVGTTIPAGSMFVLANEANAFHKQYQNEEQNFALGNLNMKFPKDFATITLQDQNGYTIARMSYSDEQIYTLKADGYGYSYELDETGVWRSYTYGGTPMKTASALEENNFKNPIINEINYASSDKVDSGDWIEIYNPNDSDISLKDWMIQDKGGKISVIYDAVTIPPQGYVVFADNPEKFHTVFPNITCYQLDLSLNRYVDAVKLYNQNEVQVDEVSYSMFDTEWTKGAFETGRTLSLWSVDADNADGRNWKASLIIGSPGMDNDYYIAVPEIQDIVEIYPNPCSDVLNVSLDGAFSFELISVTGQQILNGIGEHSTQISVSKIPAGTYLLVIRHKDKSYIKSVVIR